MKRGSTALFCAIVSSFCLNMRTVQAQQSWPQKPIKIIVGLAAGGGTDATARIVANELARKLGQAVIVENRPGAGTTIAAAFTARAAPDGYTFFMASSSYATSSALFRKMTFDPYKDLRGVAQVTSVPFCWVVPRSSPANNMKELIALAKKRPGVLTYASSGVGSAGHLGGELFKSMAGVDLVNVPYTGRSPALTDLIAERVDMLLSDLYSVQARARSGDLKIMAVTSRQRAESAPDIPTVSANALPGYEFSGWSGLLAPAGVPQSIVERMNHEILELVKNPEVRRQMAAQGAELVTGPPEDFQRLIDSELKLWRSVADKANLRAG